MQGKSRAFMNTRCLEKYKGICCGFFAEFWRNYKEQLQCFYTLLGVFFTGIIFFGNLTLFIIMLVCGCIVFWEKYRGEEPPLENKQKKSQFLIIFTFVFGRAFWPQYNKHILGIFCLLTLLSVIYYQNFREFLKEILFVALLFPACFCLYSLRNRGFSEPIFNCTYSCLLLYIPYFYAINNYISRTIKEEGWKYLSFFIVNFLALAGVLVWLNILFP
jgi:CDP-diglyceride synthetase